MIVDTWFEPGWEAAHTERRQRCLKMPGPAHHQGNLNLRQYARRYASGLATAKFVAIGQQKALMLVKRNKVWKPKRTRQMVLQVTQKLSRRIQMKLVLKITHTVPLFMLEAFLMRPPTMMCTCFSILLGLAQLRRSV